ncbi:hypothetical protein [Mesorhizobium sp. M0041]|uniref:hypothetical protein n=1 Tax=Mesorhizobium sp. M0041 TaxID=2956856 RepID=UPI003336F1DE
MLARKFRSIELRAGLPTSPARHGTAFDYNIPAKRAEERSRAAAIPDGERGRKERLWKKPPNEKKGLFYNSVCIGLPGAM